MFFLQLWLQPGESRGDLVLDVGGKPGSQEQMKERVVF